jgi:quercetin dioxygenase-like cupin family protein
VRPIGFVAAVALVALLPFAAYAEDLTVVGSPAAVKWTPAPAAAGLPKGTMLATLYGDPTKPEAFATRAKFPAGSKIMPHTHPNDENITVLSGALHIGVGDKYDPKKGTAVKAGGFIHNPAGTPHYAWFTETTVIQNNSVGPSGRTWVNQGK